MSMPKRSMDEISLELTERYIELESRKIIPSEVALDYSRTQLSIQDPQETHSPLHQCPQDHALPKIDTTRFYRYGELGEGLYGIESPQNNDKAKTVLHMHPHNRTDRHKQHESLSPQLKHTKEIKPRVHQQKSRCRSLGNKSALPPKLTQHKENQQTYEVLKLRLEEERRKYQPFRVTFRGWEYKRASHLLGEGERQSPAVGVGDFLAKRIRLDYNEAQEKKYLQRIILNRQSVLHVSQRLSRLPLIQ